MKINAYFLGSKIKRNSAFADTIGKRPISYELDEGLRSKQELDFPFVLKSYHKMKGKYVLIQDLSNVKHLWTDNLPNTFAWPIFSIGLKNVIDEHLTGNEQIDWIKAEVINGEEIRNYYIPRFAKKLDVLNLNQSILTEHGLVMKAVFDNQKIENLSMFHNPYHLWEITSGLYVIPKLKEAIVKGKFTGIEFNPKYIDE